MPSSSDEFIFCYVRHLGRFLKRKKKKGVNNDQSTFALHITTEVMMHGIIAAHRMFSLLWLAAEDAIGCYSLLGKGALPSA